MSEPKVEYFDGEYTIIEPGRRTTYRLNPQTSTKEAAHALVVETANKLARANQAHRDAKAILRAIETDTLSPHDPFTGLDDAV